MAEDDRKVFPGQIWKLADKGLITVDYRFCVDYQSKNETWVVWYKSDNEAHTMCENEILAGELVDDPRKRGGFTTSNRFN